MRSLATKPVPAAANSQPLGRRRHSHDIVAAFNTWAYKREQPSDPLLLAQIVEQSTLAGSPIPFVLYWGKGPRHAVARPDEDCLDYLAGMARRIQAAYPAGAAIELLLTDTHAQLNQHSELSIASYFEDVTRAAGSRGFTSRRLSDVVQHMPVPVAPDSTESIADPDVLDHLTLSAAKWYGGGDTPRCAAIQYYAMNMREKRAVERAYPDTIFITFNDSRFRVLFPERLPIFYMYSLRKGFAVKPWFIEAP